MGPRNLALKKAWQPTFVSNDKKASRLTFNTLNVIPFLDPNLKTFERVLWFLSYLSAVILVGFTSYALVESFVEAPIIAMLEPNDDGLSGEVFPAVTICNLRKWLVKSVEGPELAAKIDIIKQRINKAMPICSWASKKYQCGKLFSPVQTDFQSFCYSFNYGYPEKYASLYFQMNETAKRDYKTAQTEDFPVRQSVGIGLKNGLTIILDLIYGLNGDFEISGSLAAHKSSVGYMVLVHSPEEFPTMVGPSILVAPGFENNFNVGIIKTYTSSAVKEHPTARQHKNCYTKEEKKLSYFSTYTRATCRMECIINLTESVCGCHHWTSPGSPTSRVCSNDNLTLCHMKYVDSFFRDDEADVFNFRKQCQCKRRCSFTKYDVDHSYALFNASNMANKLNTTEDYVRGNVTILNVFFGDESITVYRRDVLLTVSNFISSLCGLVGSILGWSLISIIRVVVSIIGNFIHFLDLRKGSAAPRPFYTAKKSTIKY